MAIGEFQPIDLLGMQGGLGNLPTAANVQALGNQQAAAAASIEGLQARAMAERAQAQAAQQQQARAQQFQQALATHLGDGSAQSTARLMTQFPEFAKQLGDAHALEKADIQEADTLQLNGIYSRASNGDWAGAAANAKRRLDAEKAAGNDTTDEQDLYDALTSNDPVLQKRALGIVGMDLAARVGLEKFASVYGGVTTADGNVVDRGTGRVIYEGQEKPEKPQYMNVDGTVIALGGNAGGAPATGSRAARNNNPGNLEASEWTQRQPGYVGTDGRFAIFDTPANGAAAMTSLLANNYLAKGVNTIGGIISKYAPASDGNNVNSYVGTVSKLTGIKPNQPLTPDDLPAVVAAMSQVEGGGAAGGPRVVYQGPSSGEKSVKKDVIAMRKEFDGLSEVKAYKEIAPVLMSARRAPDTPAGDIQLAYTVGKILDPNSVVREGELALAIKAGSPLERLLGQGTYVAGQGARMTPEIRRQLLEMVNERALAVRQQYDAARANYEGYARDMGVAPASIIGQHVANAYAPKGGAKSAPKPINFADLP